MFRRFAALVLLTVTLTVLASADAPIAMVTAMGKVIENGVILKSQVDEIYDSFKFQYGEFEPVFEEAYVQAYILNDLIKSLVKSFIAAQEGLGVEDFDEKHSVVTEEDMIKYYEENREQLMDEEEYVDLDYAFFSDEKSAKDFFDIALEDGFDAALEKVTPEDWDSLDGLKRSEVGTMYVPIIFGKHERNVRFFAITEGFFVFNVREHNDLSTFEKFKRSSAYASVQGRLGQVNLANYVERRKAELMIEVVAPEAYLVWLDVVDGRDFEKAYGFHRSRAFDPSGRVVTEDLWVLSGLIVLIDESEKLEKYQSDYEKLIRSIYNMNYKTWPVVARLRRFDDSEIVKLDYNVELSKILIAEYLSVGDYMSVATYVDSNLRELEELSASGNNEIAEKALEYLYRMHKALGEFDLARTYLQKLQQLNPNYFDFEEEFRSIDELEYGFGAEPGDYEDECYECQDDGDEEDGGE